MFTDPNHDFSQAVALDGAASVRRREELRQGLMLRRMRDVVVIGVLLAGGTVVAGLITLRSPPGGPASSETVRTVRMGIDPNEARWYELSQLPGIGPGLGQAIVAHREAVRRAGGGRHAVFTAPNDLLRVRGIGPQKLRQIQPFLRFPENLAAIDSRAPER